LPQFGEPAKGAVAGQILLLGFIFIVLGICSNGLYTLLAGTIGRWFWPAALSAGWTLFCRQRLHWAGGGYGAVRLGEKV